MKRLIVFLAFTLFLPKLLPAQRVMLLERPGTSRYFMYKQGDHISVALMRTDLRISGEITHLDDSSLSINNINYSLTDIQRVNRHHAFLSGLKKTLQGAAVMYFGFSAVNRAIHNEKPVIDNSVPVICSSLLALSGIPYLFQNSRYLTGTRWRLRVIDLSILKVKPEDFH
jgi:hypothetical protein